MTRSNILKRLPRLMLGRWLSQQGQSLVFRSSVVGHHGPIRIVSLSLLENSDDFVAIVEKALLLIGSVHPRGYRRIMREFRYVADSHLLRMGEYLHLIRACKIDFARFESYVSSQSSDWAVAYFACVLIHEATHGHLHSVGIAYDETTRVRVERLCVLEEQRFASRLKGKLDNCEMLVPPFDKSRWENSWSRSRWQTVKLLFRNLIQILKEKPKPKV